MKKRLAFIPLVLLATFCATGGSSSSSSSPPGAASITIEIVPNPIMARQVSGETYDFPFDVVVRERGGRPVTVTRVSADVRALGGLTVASESYDARQIQSLGYSTSVPANGELRVRFAPRKQVPDERLFSSVSADLRVDGTDDAGNAVNATTSVTVRL